MSFNHIVLSLKVIKSLFIDRPEVLKSIIQELMNIDMSCSFFLETMKELRYISDISVDSELLFKMVKESKRNAEDGNPVIL